MNITPINNHYTAFRQNTNVNKNNTNNFSSKESHINKLAFLTTLGLIGATTLLMFDRTSKTRLEKLLVSNKNEEKAFLHDNASFEIQSLKDNKNIKSIDELSGLSELKNFAKKLKILQNNKAVMQEHNAQEFSSILLWGVPGTGKTSAAMGIAKKLDADFVKLDKDIFDSSFVSEGPRQLSKYLDIIKNHANKNPDKKIVIFMDEIDGTISVDNGYNNRHSEDLINVMKNSITKLQQECKNVIFIGATNKDPNGIKSDNASVKLNNAILSRFNYQFELKLPEKDEILDYWTKLIKTESGKEKFNSKQNEKISKTFEELGMSYRDIKNISNKLNIEDAVEFCQKGSYNSKKNLIKILKNDEKIGYDHINKKNMDKKKKEQIIKKLENDFY